MHAWENDTYIYVQLLYAEGTISQVWRFLLSERSEAEAHIAQWGFDPRNVLN